VSFKHGWLETYF